ncbi:MFS transporter [Halalkalibacter krulwichiae]|uniref:Inner membrane transport protein YajR n=1 Tax=Halalkalibacter krulwichiae TaxID=199441 RepID=A0A1X9MAE7_9BACI|nr:MFS transporter [Halalkalibacter krulwichiae]ARK29624.1 Inner membrane transport protein YajR [Halalkalibacter krulwichiae]
MANQALWSKDFIFITICNLLVFLGFYYLIVTMPIYTLQELGGTEAEAGFVVTLFLLTAIVIRPFAGRWAEDYGQRIVLFSGLAILVLGSFLYVLVDSIFGLMVVRLFHGIGFGIATTATGAIVANIIPEARRGEGMGYYALSFNIAVVLGPFLGLTAIRDWSMITLFVIVIFCNILAVLFAMLLGKTRTNAAEVEKSVKKRRFEWVEKTAVPIAIVAALFAIIYSSVLSFVPVYAEEIGLLHISSYFFVVYAVAMVISRPFTGRGFDRFGASMIVYPSIAFFAVGMLLLSVSETAFLFLVAAAFIGLGWGTLFPTFQTISVQRTAPNKRGLALASFLSIFDLGIAFGSLIVGIIVAEISLHSFYFYSSFVLLLGMAVYNVVYGRYVMKNMQHQIKRNNRASNL